MSDFWAYEKWTANGHRATVHRGDYGSCNHGAGVHGGGQTPNGKWHGPFSSAESAKNKVSRPGAHLRDCARCNP